MDTINKDYTASQYYTLSFKYNQKPYTLIAYESKTTETYNDFVNARIVTFILLVVIYALITLIAINILRKRITIPLSKLKNAINEYTNNKVKINIDEQDIKEFDEITKQFNKMTVDLDEMDNINKKYEEERQIMLANISHDLKTPITIIQGYSKAIIDGVIKGDEIINKNKIIYNKTIYINELVNNFHSFSKLEHPSFVYNFKNIDIAEYLRNYLANKYNELDMHNINLDIEIPEEKILKSIDPNEFKRVFENIINNAIKYNDDGISIKVFLDNKKIVISNSGLPIPESTAKEIFKPFSMGDGSRSKGGSGLGLSIVSKIIKDHKFKIYLQTHPNDFYKVSFVIEI